MNVTSYGKSSKCCHKGPFKREAERETAYREAHVCVGGGHSNWDDVATSHPTLQPPEAREAGTFSPRALGQGRTLLTL